MEDGVLVGYLLEARNKVLSFCPNQAYERRDDEREKKKLGVRSQNVDTEMMLRTCLILHQRRFRSNAPNNKHL